MLVSENWFAVKQLYKNKLTQSPFQAGNTVQAVAILTEPKTSKIIDTILQKLHRLKHTYR